MRYFKLFKRIASVHFKQSLQQQLAFRFDFLVKLLNTILALIGSIGGLMIVFSKVQTLNGWEFYEALVVTGMFMLIQNLKNLFIGPSLSSISGLGGELWTGKFDFTLLKPVPTQLYISIRSWEPLIMIDLVISGFVIIFATFNIIGGFAFYNLLLFLITIFTSLTVLYSIMLVLASVAFWYLGTPLLWILDSIMEMGRYPVRIYPIAFRYILTWVVPVGLIISIPAESLIGKASLADIIIGVLFAIVFNIFANKFFKSSIKKYSSASS